MGNAVGLGVLLLLLALTGKFVHLGTGSMVVWASAFLVLAAVAWRIWHDKQAPKTALGWLGMAATMGLLGAVSFMVDVSFGHARDPSLSTLAAAQEAGSMFGFVFTATVFPSLVFICLAGMARAAYLSTRGDA